MDTRLSEKSILAHLLLALTLAGCGITTSKQNTDSSAKSSSGEKTPGSSDSQVAQGAFSLVQPDLSARSVAISETSDQSTSVSTPVSFDTFEVRLVPDRGDSAKDYVKRVAYAAGAAIQFDQIIAGSYIVEVNVYAKDVLVFRGTSTTFVKRDGNAKVDVELKYVAEH